MLGLAALYLVHDETLPDIALPVRPTPLDAIAAQFLEFAEERGHWPVLKTAIDQTDTSTETLTAIGQELYGLVRTHWRSILLLDRLANEIPEFAPVHADRVRGGFIGDLVTLLKKAGSPHNEFALGIIARAANEGISWSAMHRRMEGLATQPIGDLTEDQISHLAAHAFAGALQTALP